MATGFNFAFGKVALYHEDTKSTKDFFCEKIKKMKFFPAWPADRFVSFVTSW